MKKVNVDDDGLIAYYDALSISGYRLKDESKNGYDAVNIVKWIDDKEPVTDYAYSFCVVGDTQNITEKYPDKLAHMHLHDARGKSAHLPFGSGDVEIEKKLEKRGVETCLIEVKTVAGLEESLEYLKKRGE